MKRRVGENTASYCESVAIIAVATVLNSVLSMLFSMSAVAVTFSPAM